MTIHIRGPYDRESEPGIDFSNGESMTKQSFTEECDINNILAKYQKTGVINHVADHGGDYGFMDGSTFTEQMMQITKAQSMFNDLPSQAREFFEHDPAKFLEYVDKLDMDSDATQLAELGLLSPQAAMELLVNDDQVVETPPVPPAPASDTPAQPIDPT